MELTAAQLIVAAIFSERDPVLTNCQMRGHVKSG